jgi:hypothetical protein
MTRIPRALAAFLIAPLANAAFGQECPSSIEETESVSAPIESWESSPAINRRLLVGLEVVEGDPAIRPLVILAPFEGGKYAYLWQFRGAIGTRRVWMRCVYENTEIRVARRLEATVEECRVTRTRSAGRNGRWIVTAECL